MIGKASAEGLLSEDDVRELVASGLGEDELRGRKVLVVIPDSTRTCPLPLFFRALSDHIRPLAREMEFLIALGTHPPMSEGKVDELVGMTAQERRERYKVDVVNHLWKESDELAQVGTISADEVEELSEGKLKLDVPVRVNRRAAEADTIVLCGPVFPHEVVGFSGGNKYLFPGAAAQEIIDFFHGLGALITNPLINGVADTPVRAVVERAARMVSAKKLACCMVVTHEGLKGLWVGDSIEAWREAAKLSSRLHIVYKERPFERVLSMAPPMYDDIWTAGKCMYKLEPVVADGGELIIHAPHVTEISYTHGRILDEVGYHVRDYFVRQWDRFKGHPWGVLAHSTHVKGIGTFEDGVERPRVNVVLATGIPEERCRRVNLGYADPASIDPTEWEGRENEGVLLVPRAGEMLHRLKCEASPSS